MSSPPTAPQRSWLPCGSACFETTGVHQAWRAAVQASVFDEQAEWLQERPIQVAGRSAEEILMALAQARDLRGTLTLRQLSAQLFWGDSKLLDERGEMVARLLPHLQISERAIVVNVWLPESFHGVLFIENQDTYTAACRGDLSIHGLAWVYAAGFRTTAARIRHADGALLHFAGAGATQSAVFTTWWSGDARHSTAEQELYFWGDLDFAGMQILKSLRERFGDVTAWRPGYEPMLQIVSERGGHARDAAQLDPGVTGCGYADQVLLPAIRQQGSLDQESVFML